MEVVYEGTDWLYLPKKYLGELSRFRVPVPHTVHTSGLLPMVYDPLSGLFNGWYNSPWDEGKYNQYLFMKQIPGVSWNINVYEGKRDNAEYMRRNQISWDDVNHPDRLPGTGRISAGYGSTLNYVSHNLYKLYR